MKRLLIIVCALALVCGCDQQQAEKKQMQIKTKAEKDHLAEAIQHLKEANPTDAIKSFDEAIKQDPLNPEGYLLLGQVYMHMRDYSRAIDTFAAAVRIAPLDGEGYYFLSMAHGLKGEKEFAVKNAHRSVEMFRRAQDQEKFVKSLALLQGLTQAAPPPTEEK